MDSTRRTFVKHSLMGLGASMALPDLISDTELLSLAVLPPADGKVILFQGDSITDARRDKNGEAHPNHPAALGSGYAGLASSMLLAASPQAGWTCFNRGISGNKVFQLADRWDKDCLDLQPSVLSILIGVNDHWHKMKHGYDGSVEKYETDLRALLDRTQESLPQVSLIIGEPFAVKGGTAIEDNWFPEFDGYREAAQKIAEDYGAVFIPYQKIFDKALEKGPVAHWCPDGVHPSPAGNFLMARAWLKAFKKAIKA